MTKNQLEFWGLQETKRANRASEAQKRAELEHKKRYDTSYLSETARSHLANEREAYRSNTANEGIKRQSNLISAAGVSESVRSNMAREALQSESNSITSTNYLLRNSVAQQKVSEEARANAARETEQQRHNREVERQGWVNAGGKAVGSVGSLLGTLFKLGGSK